MIFLLLLGCQGKTTKDGSLIMDSEFIFSAEEVPFPSCHASTIVETPQGLVTAWFGGTHEKHKDVGIWLSRQKDGEWSKPVEIVNGVIDDSLRFPTWNPVLYYEDGELLLFYKVGPNCADWWGEMVSSKDLGKTWSQKSSFPDSIWGPIRNKPVLLEDGTLICPSSTENNGWQAHMEFTSDKGKTWERTAPLNDGDSLAAIQPTILVHPGDELQMLCRTKSNRIYTAWSKDQGRTWTPLEPTTLPNNNSGIDAVTLEDGRHLLVYNHIDRSTSEDKRNKLNLAISSDGINWAAVATIENDPDTGNEYSYPAVIQTSDGKVHITYTWHRKLIKHVTLDTSNLRAEPIVDGSWPL